MVGSKSLDVRRCRSPADSVHWRPEAQPRPLKGLEASMYAIDGKVALVTGAARGIGRAIALRLASEGASVAVTDVNEAGVRGVADEIERLGQRGLPITADVSRADQVDAMVRQTVAELGRLDIAVANAG